MKQISIFFIVAGSVLAILIPVTANATDLLEKGLVIYAEAIAIGMIALGGYYYNKQPKGLQVVR